LRQSVNIVDEGGNMQVSSYLSSPAARGLPPPFIGQGEAVYSHAAGLWALHRVAWCTELMVVLVNLASGGRRGEPCARLGAASRVVAWELLVWLPSVRRFEGSTDGRSEAAQQPA
jgi:hypothetical protein